MLLIQKFESDNGGMGILGLTAPKEFGDMDLADAKTVLIVHEEVSYLDPALSLSFLRGSKEAFLLCWLLKLEVPNEE